MPTAFPVRWYFNFYTKKLKNVLACGGTSKDGKVELQGEHKHRVREELMKLGFPEETIEVK